MEDDKQQSEEKIKSMTAIRCAKAAILLSSLTHTSSANSHRKEEVEIEMLKIECLKLKRKIRKLRLRCYSGVVLIFCFLCFFILTLLVAFFRLNIN